MKRGGFKRPERPARAPIVLTPATRAATYAGSTTGPVPKGPPARPGKGAQTQEEKRWIEAILSFGCVACWLDGFMPLHHPCEVHHLLRGGVRMGHLYSLPLCQPGHHRNGQQVGLVSRHPWKARFEAKYGTELELLNRLQVFLGFPVLTLEAT